FEPSPSNIELLELNAARTRHRNVTVIPLALGDRETRVRFVVPLNANSGSGYVLGPNSGSPPIGSDQRVVEIRSTTLDAMLPQLRPPRLVVIDAEGHEAAILRGAERLLLGHRPVIVLEVLESLLRRAGTTP